MKILQSIKWLEAVIWELSYEMKESSQIVAIFYESKSFNIKHISNTSDYFLQLKVLKVLKGYQYQMLKLKFENMVSTCTKSFL